MIIRKENELIFLKCNKKLGYILKIKSFNNLTHLSSKGKVKKLNPIVGLFSHPV